MGNADAMYQIGCMHWNGAGMAIDELIGANWYVQAAKQGHAEAAYRVGILFRDGTVVRKNLNEAYQWLEFASSKGHNDARRALREIVVA